MVLLIFVARGWAGSFPSKISTAGMEYLAQSAANEAIGHGDRSRDLIEDLEAKQLELAASLREEMQALENRLTRQI